MAHEIVPSIATLKFETDRSFTLSVKTNLEAQIAGIGDEHEDTDQSPQAQQYNTLRSLSDEDLKGRFEKIQERWISEIGLRFAGEKVDLKLDELSVPETGDVANARETSVVLSGRVPNDADAFSWQFPASRGASVLRVERPGQTLQAQFYAAGASSDKLSVGVAKERGFIEKSYDYAVIGFTHILPKGLDHILFVLGLFLLSLNWRPLLVQVTAFTIAHSITLAFGLYGILRISPSIVEPLIALSIVYVAVENVLTTKLTIWRPIIVFAFGLLHGLGFAGILSEIGLPREDFVLGLVAFNVGVELGQLAVIAIAFLLVGWFANRPWYRSRITIPASLAIGAMGLWWVVERTLL